MRLPCLLTLSCAAAIAAPAVLGQTPPTAERLRRGEYLATIMDCSGCHTPGTLLGKPDLGRALGGSEVGFQIPGLGTFYPPNLTPDRETGLGRWSESDITDAIRKGERPDGRMLAPIMPYQNYGRLTDGDAAALVAYLRSLRPVRNAVPAPVGPSEKPASPFMTVVVP